MQAVATAIAMSRWLEATLIEGPHQSRDLVIRLGTYLQSDTLRRLGRAKGNGAAKTTKRLVWGGWGDQPDAPDRGHVNPLRKTCYCPKVLYERRRLAHDVNDGKVENAVSRALREISVAEPGPRAPPSVSEYLAGRRGGES